MKLNDLFESQEPVPQSRYDVASDKTGVKASSSRKVRLTLAQINKLRRMHDVRRVEQQKQNDFFKIIYGTPPQQ